ncbi:unnamed protein product [Lactuca saligna]|uniref:Uncharacterized protein n=1 Tax=Lactuca saligna TaxID=75948 RepID=A0AA35YND2_LACSI|nr:unnamed protein product [Lactuca saligna]
MQNKEGEIEDPFGIYETLENMRVEESFSSVACTPSVQQSVDKDRRAPNVVAAPSPNFNASPPIVTPVTGENVQTSPNVLSAASTMAAPVGQEHRGNPPVGFSGGFGHMEGIDVLEDNLTHPLGFSNFMGGGNFSQGSFNNFSFLKEIQKTLDIGRSLGYNMDGCFDRVKEIVEGHEGRKVF